jgi:tetraacyldisaccharide-1-P 4'-kinase
MRTIAFAHQKGGTGKTTLAIATAMALAQRGVRVLCSMRMCKARPANESDGRWTVSEVCAPCPVILP